MAEEKKELTQLEKMKETCDNIERMHYLLRTLKIEHGLHSIQVARATDDYFELSYEQRRQFLGCASTFALCKTIIMQNSRHQEECAKTPEVASDPTYPRFVVVITQFEGKLNAQKILHVMKEHQNTRTTGKKVGSRGFHFRLAEEADALALSGYAYNAITPFLMQGGGE